MDEMEQLYQQVILDHAREKHGSGDIDTYDAESFQVNPTCGDEVRLRVRIDHEGPNGVPRIAQLGWVGQGCSISQASQSVMAGLVEGRSVTDADQLHETFRELMQSRGNDLEDAKSDLLEDATAFVGVARYPARIKCALLGWMALRDATINALTENSEMSND